MKKTAAKPAAAEIDALKAELKAAKAELKATKAELAEEWKEAEKWRNLAYTFRDQAVEAQRQTDRAWERADEAMKKAEAAQTTALGYLEQMKAGTFYTTPATPSNPQPHRHTGTPSTEPQPNTRRAWMPRRRRF